MKINAITWISVEGEGGSAKDSYLVKTFLKEIKGVTAGNVRSKGLLTNRRNTHARSGRGWQKVEDQFSRNMCWLTPEDNRGLRKGEVCYDSAGIEGSVTRKIPT
ncbi:hypothetical protein TNCV_1366691 [Trichonephila clavipes]|nr:hypothetical protein TNCV_1366691 [Trichonephila clavipes]